MKLKQTLIAIALAIGFCSAIVVPAVHAVNDCGGGIKTSVIPCETGGQGGIWGILRLTVNILTGVVGVAAVGGVVYGSILYATAQGDVAKVHKARVLIANVVVGILAYVAAYSFLNFIIPGGLFA